MYYQVKRNISKTTYIKVIVSHQGLIFAALKSRITTGPLVETLNYFEIHLSAQVKCSLFRYN